MGKKKTLGKSLQTVQKKRGGGGGRRAGPLGPHKDLNERKNRLGAARGKEAGGRRSLEKKWSSCVPVGGKEKKGGAWGTGEKANRPKEVLKGMLLHKAPGNRKTTHEPSRGEGRVVPKEERGGTPFPCERKKGGKTVEGPGPGAKGIPWAITRKERRKRFWGGGDSRPGKRN